MNVVFVLSDWVSVSLILCHNTVNILQRTATVKFGFGLHSQGCLCVRETQTGRKTKRADVNCQNHFQLWYTIEHIFCCAFFAHLPNDFSNIYNFPSRVWEYFFAHFRVFIYWLFCLLWLRSRDILNWDTHETTLTCTTIKEREHSMYIMSVTQQIGRKGGKINVLLWNKKIDSCLLASHNVPGVRLQNNQHHNRNAVNMTVGPDQLVGLCLAGLSNLLLASKWKWVKIQFGVLNIFAVYAVTVHTI